MFAPTLPVKRNALGFFSIGVFFLVSSLVILAIWMSSFAHNSEDFISAAFFCWPLSWVGNFLLFWSLAGFGVNRLLMDLSWLVGLVGVVLSEFFTATTSASGSLGGIFLLALATLVSVAVLVLLLYAQRGAALKGLLLGLGSAAVVLVVYGVGRLDLPLTLWGPTDSRVPPEPGWSFLGSIMLLGVALFFLARLWSRPAQAPRPQSSSPRPPSEQDILPENI